LLTEKDNKIEELHYVIEVLEMKLRNATDIQNKQERRINDLTQFLKERGINI
jgi:hypothetical protein